LENLVYLELRKAGYEVYIGVFRKGEVDFVAIQGDKKIYIQCAYLLTDEQTISREYNPLESISDSYEKIVISLNLTCRSLS